MRARVTGRVQGVWYRGATQERAASLGLVGWVRNRRDGSVELEVEGAPAIVEQLIGWCRSGPSAARVSSVDTELIELKSNEQHFEIRH